MKQTKIMAIMQAQKIFTTLSMEGYKTTMQINSKHSIKRIDVSVWYDNPKEGKEIKEILEISTQNDDKIINGICNNCRWINWSTLYE